MMATETQRDATLADDRLRIGEHTLASRLIVGTGKYASYELMGQALDASGADCITVAVRRERLLDSSGQNILDFIDTKLHVAAEHGRLLFGRRRGPRGADGSRNPVGPR